MEQINEEEKTNNQEPTEEEVKQEKTEAEIKTEEQNKKREEEMEQIVIMAREKLLPILKAKNKSIEDSKMMLDVLAVALQNSMFYIMRETPTSATKLNEKIDKSYPNYEEYLEIWELIKDESMMQSTQVLQWMVDKINQTIKDKNKEVKFNELGIEI